MTMCSDWSSASVGVVFTASSGWAFVLPGGSTALVEKGRGIVARVAPDEANVPLGAGELLLSNSRVAVGATWRSQYSGQTGTATPTPQRDAFGLFYFSTPTNPEIIVKALDFGADQPYLLFWGGLTDYEYTLTFRNVATGQSVSYKKDAGSYNGGADKKTLLH